MRSLVAVPVRVVVFGGPARRKERLPTQNGTDMTLNYTLVAELTLSRGAIDKLLDGRSSPIRFERCVFDGEDLSRLDLRGCVFVRCSLATSCLSRALLGDSEWIACRAGGCDFSWADLSDARFNDSDLNNSNWTGARLAAVVFDGAKLTGATFGDVRGLGLAFQNSLLVGADLRGLSFRKQRLIGLDFSGADLGGCDFRDAVFDGGSLRDANLRQARFEGSDLRQVVLGTLTVEQVSSFKRAVISPEQAAMLAASMGLLVA
jgi:fluoroquinolone resistance protein